MAITGGVETRVNTQTADDQVSPQVTALSDGSWVVTWTSGDGSEHGVYQQAYNSDGSPRGGETLVNTHVVDDQITPSVAALADGGWVTTWQSTLEDLPGPGIYQQAYHADGSVRGAETRLSSGLVSSAYLPNVAALADGRWVVTWSTADDPHVYQQVYNADGSQQRNTEAVSDASTSLSADEPPQIVALASGGWVISWTLAGAAGSAPDVYQRVFNADGSAKTAPIHVDIPGDSNEAHHRTAALPDGGWVVTWVAPDTGPGDVNGDVHQGAYNADGSVRGGEVTVNTTTLANQSAPEITALASGGWVVTWLSGDGSGQGVFQQAYHADGTVQGGEVQVNTTTAMDQAFHKVTALDGGGWVVTWQSAGQDGDQAGIYQQAYRADGSAEGTETQVNTTVTGAQTEPTITALASGKWIVTWASDGQDGSGEGIYQRTFQLNHEAPSGTDKTVSLAEDGSHTFSAGDFGFADRDGDHLSGVIVTTLPGSGVLTLHDVAVTAGQSIAVGDLNTLVWTPAANAHGDGLASLTFQVVDDGGTADGGADTDASANTIHFNVSPVSDAPVGADATVGVLEDGSHTFSAADFSFSDADGDALSAVIISTVPATGSLTLAGADVTAGQSIAAAQLGDLVWRPAANAAGNGLASLDFKVVDSGGTANGGANTDATANRITFNVTAVNDAPSGASTTISVLEHASHSFSAGDFGFSDPDGNALSAVIITSLPGAGTLTLNGTDVTAGQSIAAAALGDLVWTAPPDANGAGLASLGFKVVDDGGTANGGSDTAATADTITFNVGDVPDPPVAVNDTAAVGEDATVTGNVLTGPGADHDADGDTLTVTGVSNTSGSAAAGSSITGRFGTLVITAAGSFSYIADAAESLAAGQTDTDVFTYTITDGTHTATATLTVSVTGLSDSTAGDDTVTGTAGNDDLRGGRGDDVLSAGAGNDTLNGGAGFDVLVGGAGDDTYVLGADNDVVVDTAGIDTIQSIISRSLVDYPSIENLTLTGTNAVNGTGNALDNTITGNAAANTLSGGGGADHLIGGAGNDIYVVDGSDTVTELPGEGTDTVYSSVAYALTDNVENLVLTGSARSGTGNALGNSITGNAAANVLNGGAGNDTLDGKGGKDTLIGGAGNDFFVFDTRLGAANIDRITDYSVAADTIELDNSVFTKLHVGHLAAAAFVKNASGHATDAADRIVYETDTGKLFYDADGSGKGAAIQIAQLNKGLALTYHDFLVI